MFFNQFLNKIPLCKKKKKRVIECTLYISTEGNFLLSKSTWFDKVDARNGILRNILSKNEILPQSGRRKEMLRGSFLTLINFEIGASYFL